MALPYQRFKGSMREEFLATAFSGAPARRRFDWPQNPAGQGCVRIDRVAGQSAVCSLRASSPLKILVPRPRGPSVWVYLGSFGGGVVAGDETKVTLRLGEHACGFVSTQASTKLYRSPASRPGTQRLHATLGEGARLVLMPDPLQAFAGSDYRQSQEFHLTRGSGLVVLDWLSSGRVARGERWALSRFHSRTEVYYNGQRIFLDSLCLNPADGPLAGPYRLGRFNSLAMVLVLGDALEAASTGLVEDMTARPVARRASLVVSASPVAHGTVLRIAGERVEEVTGELRRCLAFVPGLIGDDPWSRKW
jgi:urease accessory protein